MPSSQAHLITRLLGSCSAALPALLWGSSALAQAAAPAATAPAAPPEPAPAASPPPAAAEPAAGAALWQAPPPAAPPPDTNTSTMDKALSFFGSIGYGYGYGAGYGLGARFQLVVADHVLHLPPGKHDEFGIEFGMDWYHVSYDYPGLGTQYDRSYNEFTPVVGVTWNFWLTDKLALYPKIDLGYRFISWNDDKLPTTPGLGHIYFQGTGGVVYKLGAVSLRAELGWASIHAGVGLHLF